MQILGADVLEVLREHLEKLQAAVEQRFAGDIEHADATNVLVHDLFEPLQAMQRRDVARRHGASDDLVTTDAVGFQWLEYRLPESLDFIVIDLS